MSSLKEFGCPLYSDLSMNFNRKMTTKLAIFVKWGKLCKKEECEFPADGFRLQNGSDRILSQLLFHFDILYEIVWVS